MLDALLEKTVCEKCGVTVRENTSFCYSCGSPIVHVKIADASVADAAPDANGAPAKLDVASQTALDDLAKMFDVDEAVDDKLAKAATERKKARVSQRKVKTIVWEPVEDSSTIPLVLFAAVITLIVAGVVILMVFWK